MKVLGLLFLHLSRPWCTSSYILYIIHRRFPLNAYPHTKGLLQLRWAQGQRAQGKRRAHFSASTQNFGGCSWISSLKMARLSKDMKLRKKTCAEVKEKEVGTLNSLQVQDVFLLPHFVQLPPNLPMSSCYCFSFNRCVGVSSRSFQSAYSQKRTCQLVLSQ